MSEWHRLDLETIKSDAMDWLGIDLKTQLEYSRIWTLVHWHRNDWPNIAKFYYKYHFKNSNPIQSN